MIAEGSSPWCLSVGAPLGRNMVQVTPFSKGNVLHGLDWCIAAWQACGAEPLAFLRVEHSAQQEGDGAEGGDAGGVDGGEPEGAFQW
jgi:hypothetical protein